MPTCIRIHTYIHTYTHACIHAQIEGMSDSDVLDFYELVARDLCVESQRLRMRLEQLVSNAKPKHDSNMQMSRAVSACVCAYMYVHVLMHIS
jgi:hypothetical protein